MDNREGLKCPAKVGDDGRVLALSKDLGAERLLNRKYGNGIANVYELLIPYELYEGV